MPNRPFVLATEQRPYSTFFVDRRRTSFPAEFTLRKLTDLMWRTFSISFTTAILATFAFLLFDLVGSPCGGTKLPRVDADFQAISSSIKTYRLNAGHYPTTEQGLKALVKQPVTDPPLRHWVKIADRLPVDPWNNIYRYRRLPEDHPAGFEITSAGKDGEYETEDDLSSLDLR